MLADSRVSFPSTTRLMHEEIQSDEIVQDVADPYDAPIQL
jgi:hypothetical protein